MTRRTSSSIVHLSTRDWACILAVAATMGCALLASYLRHDRMLTELLTNMASAAARIEAVERSVDRLEDRAMERTPATP